MPVGAPVAGQAELIRSRARLSTGSFGSSGQPSEEDKSLGLT